MRGTLKIWAMLALTVTGVAGCARSVREHLTDRAGDGLLVRELRACIQAYREAHDGAFPQSVGAMTQHLNELGITMPHQERWTNLLCVANILDSDPDQMPVMISRPERGAKGIVVTKDGAGVPFEHLDEDLRNRIFREPWALVEYLAPGTEISDELKNRVHVEQRGADGAILAPGVARPHSTQEQVAERENENGDG